MLSFAQAEAKVRAMVASPEANGSGPIVQLTVRQAMARYVDYKRHKGQPVGDLVEPRQRAHSARRLAISWSASSPAEQLRRWLAAMAAAPAQRRPKGNKPQYEPEPTTDEEIRQRRASANRVLTMLKAALNHAYDEGHVANRDAWGPQARSVREGRGGTRALSNSARRQSGSSTHANQIFAAGPRRAGNRLPLRRADPARGLRLQSGRQHAGSPADPSAASRAMWC